jgi:hypothetical protein
MRYLKNQTGNIFIIVAVILVLMGGVLAKVYFFSTNDSNGINAYLSPEQQFEEYKQRVQQSLANAQVMDQIFEKNPNQFSCLYSDSGVCKGAGGVFILYDSQLKQALSQLPRDQGFDLEGKGCLSFPSKNCVFHIEAKWSPVCAGVDCTATKSANIMVSVTYDAGNGTAPMQWSDAKLLTPAIQLSARAICARQGGYYNGQECLSSMSEDQRGLASSASGVSSEQNSELAQPMAPQAVEESQSLICPETIKVNGEEYVADSLGPARAQVSLPAANGCPAADMYVFTCNAKADPSFSGEGIWMQAEFQPAPPCDQNGRPSQAGVVHGSPDESAL